MQVATWLAKVSTFPFICSSSLIPLLTCEFLIISAFALDLPKMCQEFHF